MFFKDKPYTEPKDGECRELRQFAWRPTKVNGGTVWLESYAINQRYFRPTGGGLGWWSEGTKERLDRLFY